MNDEEETQFAKEKEAEIHFVELPIDDELNKILTERHGTHGLFSQNALISQELKALMRRLGHGFVHYDDVHKEALDMIALKLSRILSGQANFKDHWDDIAGYARLGAEACNTK